MSTAHSSTQNTDLPRAEPCTFTPGQKPDDVIREIRAVVGAEIELALIMTSQGTDFPVDTPLYRLLEKSVRTMDPGGIVFPLVMPGAMDASMYQQAGITMYGFTPGIFPKNFPVLKMVLGHAERFPISAIETGLPVLWEVISEFCAN